jgi:hypothetical protein
MPYLTERQGCKRGEKNRFKAGGVYFGAYFAPSWGKRLTEASIQMEVPLSLIEEIQHTACDSNCDLGAVLCKCKVLAARLGSQPLENWLMWESNGYPHEVEPPKYRIWPLTLKGHFSGSRGSRLNNAPIPLRCLPKKISLTYQKYKCRQSIASIERLLRGEHEGSFHLPSEELAVHVGEKVYTGLKCLHVNAVVGVGNLQEVLNAVRNRVLDFSLAVWKENPHAGSTSAKPGKGIKPAKISKIFSKTVYPGSANLVVTDTDSQVAFQVTENDINSLECILRENDVNDEDIANLRSALKDEPRLVSEGRFGPRVSDWISLMIRKACEGSWEITIDSAGKLVAEAISRYYGLQ